MALLKRKRTGLTDPMSVVTRFVNACNRHDADAIYSCLHPDFDSIQPMYPARNFRGADQVRRNWQAIFDAEPGFRLTVLRQAAADDTVWLELHGAGDEAEVAGVFVMGIQGDRVRWARIYSALVEPLPPGMEPHVPSSPAALRGVPPLKEGDGPAAASEPVVEEDLIAPVVDIEESGRSRRRRRRRGQEPAETPVVAEDEAVDVPTGEDDAEPHAVSREAAEAALEDLLAEPGVVDTAAAEPSAAPAETAAVSAETAAEPGPEPEPEPLVISTVEPVAEPLEEREPEVVAEPIVVPEQEAAAVVVEGSPEPPAAAGAEPDDVPPPAPEALVPTEADAATAEPAPVPEDDTPLPEPEEAVAATTEPEPAAPASHPDPEPTATAAVEPEPDLEPDPEPTAVVEPEPEPEPEPAPRPGDDDEDGSSGKRRGWLRR